MMLDEFSMVSCFTAFIFPKSSGSLQALAAQRSAARAPQSGLWPPCRASRSCAATAAAMGTGTALPMARYQAMGSLGSR